jgi:hypothetical protein
MKARLLLALFFVSLAFNASQIAGPLDWRMPLAALAAWWTADLLSGLVHMWMDYRPCVAGVGLKELYFWDGSRESEAFMALQAEVYARINLFERVCYDFKKHHPMPDLLGRHGVFHLMQTPTFFITLPLSLELNVLTLFWRPPGWAMVFAVVLLLGNSLTQYFHGTLHKVRSPWPIRLMRGAGLLMTPAAHQHHHDTLRHDFSVINGWSNPALNLLVNALRRAGLLDEAGLVPG